MTQAQTAAERDGIVVQANRQTVVVQILKLGKSLNLAAQKEYQTSTNDPKEK